MAPASASMGGSEFAARSAAAPASASTGESATVARSVAAPASASTGGGAATARSAAQASSVRAARSPGSARRLGARSRRSRPLPHDGVCVTLSPHLRIFLPFPTWEGISVSPKGQKRLSSTLPHALITTAGATPRRCRALSTCSLEPSSSSRSSEVPLGRPGSEVPPRRKGAGSPSLKLVSARALARALAEERQRQSTYRSCTHFATRCVERGAPADATLRWRRARWRRS